MSQTPKRGKTAAPVRAPKTPRAAASKSSGARPAAPGPSTSTPTASAESTVERGAHDASERDGSSDDDRRYDRAPVTRQEPSDSSSEGDEPSDGADGRNEPIER